MRGAERAVIYVIVALGSSVLAQHYATILINPRPAVSDKLGRVWNVTINWRTFAELNLSRMDETTRDMLKQAGFNDFEILNYIIEHCGTEATTVPAAEKCRRLSRQQYNHFLATPRRSTLVDH